MESADEIKKPVMFRRLCTAYRLRSSKILCKTLKKLVCSCVCIALADCATLTEEYKHHHAVGRNSSFFVTVLDDCCKLFFRRSFLSVVSRSVGHADQLVGALRLSYS